MLENKCWWGQQLDLKTAIWVRDLMSYIMPAYSAVGEERVTLLNQHSFYRSWICDAQYRLAAIVNAECNERGTNKVYKNNRYVKISCLHMQTYADKTSIPHTVSMYVCEYQGQKSEKSCKYAKVHKHNKANLPPCFSVFLKAILIKLRESLGKRW